MEENTSIFEKTYRNYLTQLAEINLASLSEKLGISAEKGEAIIPLFGESYRVSAKGILGPSGERPSFDVCVILCKYLLLCPTTKPLEKDWVSFRDLKDTAPLINYFANEVERAISSRFSGRLNEIKEGAKDLGGSSIDVQADYDLRVKFTALPMIPVILLFNDADDEFPATCSILFERRAEKYLDAECLAIAGRLLFTSLNPSRKN
jgi:hypothetical protein